MGVYGVIVYRCIQFLARHHAGHPAGHGTLQLLIWHPGQGARDGGGVGRMVPEEPERLLQHRPVHPGEEGDVRHGGLAADQAQQGQAQNGLKGFRTPLALLGSETCSKRLNRDSAASISIGKYPLTSSKPQHHNGFKPPFPLAAPPGTPGVRASKSH